MAPGLGESALVEHCLSVHGDGKEIENNFDSLFFFIPFSYSFIYSLLFYFKTDGSPQTCPICASRPGGNPK